MKPFPKAKIINSAAKRYGLAAAVAVITIFISILLTYFSIKISLTLLIVAALIISAWYGGRGPGLMVAAIFEIVTVLSNPIPPDTSMGSFIFGRFSNFLLMASIILLVSSRRHTEKHLDESLEELANIKFALDVSSIVAITDQKGKITFVNDKFCEISGYSREKLLGQDHRIINSQYHSKEFIRNLWKTIASGGVWKGEIKNRRKDGSFYWVDTTIVPFLDNQGKPYQYVAIRNDITEKKLAETALRQKALLIEQSYEPVFVWDFERGIIDWNKGSERLYGYTREEALGKVSYELLKSTYPVSITEYLTELKKNGFWAGEVYQRTKDGREVVVDSRQQMLELDDHQIVLVTNRDITEHKRAEERIRLVVESAPNALLMVNRGGKITLVNSQTEKLFGYPREELLNESVEMLVPERFRQHHAGYRGGFFSSPQVRKMGAGRDLFGLRRDGSEVPVEIGLNPMITEEGEFVLISVIDITERKLSEKALRESEERYRLLFENNPFPMWVYDLETLKFLAVNEAASFYYGYSEEEFLSMTILNIRPEEDAAALLKDVSKIKAPIDPADVWRHRKKDGTVIEVEVSSHELTFDGRGARLVLANDVTERRRAEEELRKSEERYRALASSAQMVWIADAQGFLSNPSANWSEITGLSTEDAKNHWWLTGVHPDDRAFTLEKWKQAIESREVYEVENRVLTADGSYCYFYSRGVPVFNENGSVREWVGMSVDINERKAAEQAIQQLNETLEQRVAERTIALEAVNKELEAFSYSVSHDLRSPLRAIDGFSRALLEDYADKLDKEGQNYLERVRAGSQNMARLIEDLLNLSRVTRSEIRRESVNLSALVREIAERLRESQPERDAAFDIQEDILVNGDERLLSVAMENLLSNAWKFTSKRERAEISFGQCFENGKAEYFIRDNGAGFDMAYADKLFGAFQRLHSARDFEGTGVGLATVQRIIRRHGGKIRAESRVDEGTVFYFTL